MKAEVLIMDVSKTMIYADMDGTLLTSWDQGPVISDNNKMAIRNWIASEGLFSVATGRNLKNGPTHLEEFDLELPMVLVNGALIYSAHTKRILKTVYLKDEFYQEALAFFDQNLACALVLSDEYEVYAITHTQADEDLLDFIVQPIAREKADNLKLLKVTFVTKPENHLKILHQIMKFKTINFVNVTPSSESFIEIVDKHANKAEGIRWVLSHYPLQNRTLVCIGDYTNDEEMLKLAEVSAVPENGLAALKAKANIITSDHNHDAIADLMFKLQQFKLL
jgi:Cof subfamily protein (haloacid dehalogenase superfamily)